MRVRKNYVERDYLKEFIWVWVKATFFYAIGGFIGSVFGNGFNTDLALGMSAMMFGFTFFEKVVRFNLFGNHDTVILFWIFKVLISIVIGIFAFPVVNIYYIIMIIYSVVNKSGQIEE